MGKAGTNVALFESMLTLVVVAILLLQVSRRLAVPYPALLALAGGLVAALPWSPQISMDPRLALTLFIAPTLLDAAYDLPPRSLRPLWIPLVALAGLAVVMTTAAVAWAGVALAGMPLVAAVALGAIVAPPDAAAASTMLGRFSLPRRTVTVLKGESLLNDAVALLIFATAVGWAQDGSLEKLAPEVALAVPGGLLLGYLTARAYIVLSRPLEGTLGGTIASFAGTFTVWVIADRLHLSAILAVVANAMTLAHHVPYRQRARDRVNTYAVWGTVVFLLNVLAFLLTGLQARSILSHLGDGQLDRALEFAGTVLAVVVGVRLAWVMLYNRLVNLIARWGWYDQPPSLAQGLVVSWCGMRGLVTLATALALPEGFPERDLIVLCALAVVLGTLVAQGLTLGPLIRLLRFPTDDSLSQDLTFARGALLDAALASLEDKDGDGARLMREIYERDRAAISSGRHPREASETAQLRRETIAAKRRALADLRRGGRIDDDVFHTLEQELDWAELAAALPDELELAES
ncbi:cation:proton antiporter [Nitrospirillum viridazoti]|uniref:cation:proton antiporter n=1 Tax=Nitrospirillum viridazoti TaxID=3144925 RepID=UPI0011AD353E|nr:cation:proton antiporter [Nitrospirillum amazonense]TWB43035.1 sodium/proton antiporter (CPA1 family) [Nitrospirillum amazonense]